MLRKYLKHCLRFNIRVSGIAWFLLGFPSIYLTDFFINKHVICASTESTRFLFLFKST